MEKTSFLVILPAHNEAANIARAITSVRACAREYIFLDIVVVDDRSTDATVDIVRSLGVHVIVNDIGQRKTISQLRNRGAQAATTDILAFLDADMLVPDNWLEKTTHRFAKNRIAALGFIDRVPDEASWVGRIWGNRSLAVPAEKTTDYLPGRNLLVRREAFEEIFGFDESLHTCEDKDFTYRLKKAGYPVFLSPATTLTHLGYERSLLEFLRKEFWRQSSTMAFARRHAYNLRTLRNPMLSLWHIVCAAAFLALLASGEWRITLLTALAWVLPSVLLSIRNWATTAKQDITGLIFLSFLRWNVSGLALAWQLVQRLLIKREERVA